MTRTSEPSFPIAELKTLLSQRVGLDLSPTELAEILWLALRSGEAVRDNLQSQPAAKPPALGERPDRNSSSRQATPSASASAALVTELPRKPEADPETDQTAGVALPVNIPEAIALRNRQAIARSLRPLMRKVPSRLRQAIDEESTALQIAETQTWSPVVKPEPERWLELAIVVEVTNLLDVWRDTIAEFRQLMERQGAFRNVRTWQLQPNAAGEPQLFLQTAAGLRGSIRNPRELLDAGGRRLILFLSDCTSRAWRSGKIPQLLALWSQENPVTIVHLLPEHYWDRSALGLGYAVALRSRLPGALSRDWVLDGLSPRRRQQVPRGLKLPVVTMQPESLRQWARAMAAIEEQRTTGIVLNLPAFSPQAPNPQSAPLTAKQLVQRFRRTASDRAQELADMMAVLPVNWSVIRLIQKSCRQAGAELWQQTGALDLAEIFLSGLLRPLSPEPKQAQNRKATPQYDFVEGVREVILGTIPISEAEAVGEKIATEFFHQLPPEVQQRVNADIDRRFGDSLSYFEAFLVPDLPWGEFAAAEIFPFARVTRQVLQRWGGDYAALAEELESNRDSSRQQILSNPTLVETDRPEPPVTWKTLEFEVATIGFEDVVEEAIGFEEAVEEAIGFEDDPEEQPIGFELEEPEVQPFEFEVATVEIKQTGLIRNRNQVVIHRQVDQAWQYVEALGDDVGLEMVSIPGGKFLMGSPEGEPEQLSWEGPQHPVSVPPFFLGKYPVTQAQWRVVAALPSVNQELNSDPADFKGDRRPVETVSWLDAVEFCDRLSNATNKAYRLPSESEWEYACRAGTTTPFHFGETITTELANYDGNSIYGRGSKGEYRKQTTEVGIFSANAFGLCDLHGNVWEWCLDHWHSNYQGAPIDGSAWLDENSDRADRRVLRGGSWVSDPRYCRSAFRNRNSPVDRSSSFGFRVVCAVPRGLP